MATRVNIEDTIFDGVFAAVGHPDGSPVAGRIPESNIVWADQPNAENESAPQPDGLYLTLNIIAGLSRVGLHDEVRMPPPSSPRTGATVVGQREFTLSVQTYGTGAEDLIQGVINYFQKPSVNGAMQRAQIDVIQVATVADDTFYRIDVGDNRVAIDSGPGATAESIRDALVTAIDALGTVTVTAETAVDELKIETALGEDLPLTLNPVDEDDKLVFDTAQHQNAVDIAYLRDSGETPLTDLVDGIYWEKRSNVDFFFLTKTRIDDDAGLIETVEITDESFTGDTFSIGA